MNCPSAGRFSSYVALPSQFTGLDLHAATCRPAEMAKRASVTFELGQRSLLNIDLSVDSAFLRFDLEMKIVVVDHVFLEKEHVERLKALGDLKVFGEPPKNEDELKERIDSAEIVVVGWSHLTREVIASAKGLRMISIWATTCHYADHEAAKE